MLDLVEQHRGDLPALCRKYDVRRLDVFGSAVRGDFSRQTSDLDFLVDFNNFTIHTAAERYFDLLFDLQKLFGRKIDLVCDEAISNPYFRGAIDSERLNLYAE